MQGQHLNKVSYTISQVSVSVWPEMCGPTPASKSKRLVVGVTRGLGMVRLQGRLNQQLRGALKDRFKVWLGSRKMLQGLVLNLSLWEPRVRESPEHHREWLEKRTKVLLVLHSAFSHHAPDSSFSYIPRQLLSGF